MSVPDYLISTPENVDLHLEFAGLGNRILACAIDTALSYGLVGILILVEFLVIKGIDFFGLDEHAVRSGLLILTFAISSIFGFIVIFGYFVFFELLWRGQTPGKRAVGIRVIEANGQPVSNSSVWIRNLVRTIDEALFLVGILSMLIDRYERRLGDLAANTIVIREREPFSADKIRLSTTLTASDSIDAGLITPQEYELLVNFLSRRQAMAPDYRPQVAKQLADHFTGKMNDPDLVQQSSEPEIFLEKLLLSYRARGEE